MRSVLALTFSMFVNFSQFAFQRFYCLIGSVGMGSIDADVLISDGEC